MVGPIYRRSLLLADLLIPVEAAVANYSKPLNGSSMRPRGRGLYLGTVLELRGTALVVFHFGQEEGSLGAFPSPIVAIAIRTATTVIRVASRRSQLDAVDQVRRSPLGSTAWSQRGLSGAGTPSCLQIARTKPGPISLCRGRADTSFCGPRHFACLVPPTARQP
jgi:hypothetical protein